VACGEKIAPYISDKGIDSDGDGVRDDVQRYIALTYRDSIKIQKALTQNAIAYQNLIVSFDNETKAIENAKEGNRALMCLLYILKNELNYDFTLEKYWEISDNLKAIVLNTYERSKAYIKADSLLSGETFYLPSTEKEKKECCGFNPDDF
jgi:hypothetical protein